MEIANLSYAELKTLVIRMLKELTEYGNNIKEEMKVTVSEIKTNLQGTNSEGKEARTQINDLEHKDTKTTNQNRKKKKEDRVWSLWDTSKCASIQIIGMPEREEEQ